MAGRTDFEPYVGPRPFEREDRNKFFGREAEATELSYLIQANPLVLLYATSGAGKTSLLNARLIPMLEEEEFEILSTQRGRVPIPKGVQASEIKNLYLFNSFLSWSEKQDDLGRLAKITLARYLKERPRPNTQEGLPKPRVVIFDQFEELFRMYQDHWQERADLFSQINEALEEDRLLRIVFAMQEEYIAQLDPYEVYLPEKLRIRYRIERLNKEAALEAIVEPLRGTPYSYASGVPQKLVEKLLVKTPEGNTGEFVEPVLLQVVCRNLWASLPSGVQEISSEHLKVYGDVDQALQEFYDTSIEQARASQGVKELHLRQWFEEQLITTAGTRGIVFRGAKRTAGLPNPVVDFLAKRHLIRWEWRAGSRWYELTHDRFIEPIRRANERWRVRRRQHRLRWSLALGIPLLLALILLAPSFFARQTAAQATAGIETAYVAQTSNAVLGAQLTAQAAEEQILVAQKNAVLAKSRQLAAQALQVEDRDLALLLAIEANRLADTEEARRSLHKILSSQAVIDGKFLREFNPEVISSRIVERLEGHKNWVLSVAFSPDSRRLVSGSADTTLILWDVAAGEAIGTPLSGHTSSVLSVTFSPDGTLIASAGSDTQILLWDASTGERVGAPLLGHAGIVTSVAFSPDGKRLASSGDDGTIRIWDVSTGELLDVEGPRASVWSLAWSPDGSFLVSGGVDFTVRIWDAETLSQVRVLRGHQGLVRSVAWSPDGQFLASGSVVEEGGQVWGEVFLWDAASGELIARPARENSQPVRTVAFNPSGMILAIGRDDGTITFWNSRTGLIQADSFKGHDNRVYSLAFSPDGRYMASGGIDQTVVLWDLYVPTRSIAFSPTGELLATSQGTVISLWNLADLTIPAMTLTGHSEDVLALAFSPDGSPLASASRDGPIRLWDVRYGEGIGPPLIGHSDAVLALDFNRPDSSILASGGQDGKVLLWNVASGTNINTLLYEGNTPVLEVRFVEGVPDLQLAGADGNLITLNLETSEEIREVLPATQGGAITSFALSADGLKVAYYQEADSAFVREDQRAQGIEISSYDQSFDPGVNPDNIDFVILLATNGLHIDSKFVEYLETAQAVPVRGATHFFQPGQPWQEQADLFLSVVKEENFHFFTLDLELEPKENSLAFARDAEQWLRYVDEQVEQKVLLQTYPSFYNRWLAPSGEWMKEWPLLNMAYPYEPDPEGNPLLPAGVTDWKIWQYTENGVGSEYGVEGDTALLDVYNGTAQEMWVWVDISTFSIYDRRSGELFRPSREILVTGPNNITFSPDGSYLAAGGGRTVSLMSSSGEEISALTTGDRTITSLGFQPDSRMLAVGMDDGRAFLWDLGILRADTDTEPTLEIACLRVNRNPTAKEWEQYFGAEPYTRICPILP